MLAGYFWPGPAGSRVILRKAWADPFSSALTCDPNSPCSQNSSVRDSEEQNRPMPNIPPCMGRAVPPGMPAFVGLSHPEAGTDQSPQQ